MYYLLPLGHSSAALAVTLLVVGLAAFLAVVCLQVALLVRSPFRGARAVEALAISVPFL